MANEMQWSFTIVVQNPSTGGGYYDTEQANLSLTQNVVGFAGKAYPLSTTPVNLDMGSLVTYGYAYFQNLDATNDILVGILGPPILSPTQNAPSTATTGGTIPANTYYIEVTATTPGGETTVSNEKSIVTTGSTSTISVAWMPGAITYTTGYNVYIGTSSGGENLVLSVAGGGTAGVTLTSLPGTSGTPPASNTTTFLAAFRLKAGEWGICRLVPNATYQAKASAGTPDLNYGVWND